ncbi:hypothetical protein KY312_02270 [Candidatus Woesearchaeota archaeon]|nr:hypothetical protein [Candidatus Woesearchaeota archaeon]
MECEQETYPKRREHYACRNFNAGDKVKAYFKGEWFLGVVVKKYKKYENRPPYILIRTYKKVDDEPNALLGGFGLEGKVSEPCNIFEHEPIEGDELYTRTYKREMTEEEKEEYDNCPF